MDGLWQGPNAITQNFDTVAWRIKLMGFNTIRLPFSFQVSHVLTALSLLYSDGPHESSLLAPLCQTYNKRGIAAFQLHFLRSLLACHALGPEHSMESIQHPMGRSHYSLLTVLIATRHVRKHTQRL